MTQIKLTYFDIRGRAEAPRLALSIADIPFEDDRIKLDKWPALKPKTPYGSLPIATIDGELTAQSGALNRYIGKITGLYPEAPLDALKVDEVLDTLEDVLMQGFSYRGPDKEKLIAARTAFVKDAVPRYYGGLEKRLKAFGKGPWACGDSVTMADLEICATVIRVRSGFMDHVPIDILDKYPRIISSYNAVMDLPAVKEWFKKYPLDA